MGGGGVWGWKTFEGKERKRERKKEGRRDGDGVGLG